MVRVTFARSSFSDSMSKEVESDPESDSLRLGSRIIPSASSSPFALELLFSLVLS